MEQPEPATQSEDLAHLFLHRGESSETRQLLEPGQGEGPVHGARTRIDSAESSRLFNEYESTPAKDAHIQRLEEEIAQLRGRTRDEEKRRKSSGTTDSDSEDEKRRRRRRRQKERTATASEAPSFNQWTAPPVIPIHSNERYVRHPDSTQQQQGLDWELQGPSNRKQSQEPRTNRVSFPAVESTVISTPSIPGQYALTSLSTPPRDGLIYYIPQSAPKVSRSGDLEYASPPQPWEEPLNAQPIRPGQYPTNSSPSQDRMYGTSTHHYGIPVSGSYPLTTGSSIPGHSTTYQPIGINQYGIPANPFAGFGSTERRLRKAVAYQLYEENSDPDAHVIAFERALRANGETDGEEIINLFGTTLRKAPQKWHDKFLRATPHSTWPELKAAFCRRYRKEQTDEQIYAAIKHMKQGSNEKVEEFYERFMDLVDNLSSQLGSGFVMTNFRTGLTDSLQYALSSREFTSMTELVNSAVST